MRFSNWVDLCHEKANGETSLILDISISGNAQRSMLKEDNVLVKVYSFEILARVKCNLVQFESHFLSKRYEFGMNNEGKKQG